MGEGLRFRTDVLPQKYKHSPDSRPKTLLKDAEDVSVWLYMLFLSWHWLSFSPENTPYAYAVPGIAGGYFVYIAISLLSKRRVIWKLFGLAFYVAFSIDHFGLDILSMTSLIDSLAFVMLLVSFVKVFQTAGEFGEEFVLGKKIEAIVHDPSNRLTVLAAFLIMMSPVIYVIYKLSQGLGMLGWGSFPLWKMIIAILALAVLLAYMVRYEPR